MEPLQLNYLQARFTVSFEKIKAVLEERKCPRVYSVYVDLYLRPALPYAFGD